MVAENVTAFPSREPEGYALLLRALARLVDAGGTWRGPQPELAEHVGVSVRTLGRMVASARAEGLISTEGGRGVLTYGLNVLLDEPREPRPLRPAPADTVAIHVAEGPERVAEGAPPVAEGLAEASATDPDSESGSRVRFLQSSSSSSTFGHPPSATTSQPSANPSGDGPSANHPTARDHDSNGGGDDGTGRMRLTPRGELQVLYGVDASPSLAAEFAELDEEGRELFASKLRRWPSTKDREHPPPSMIEAIVTTATKDMQARRLAARLEVETGPPPPPRPPAPPSGATPDPEPPRATTGTAGTTFTRIDARPRLRRPSRPAWRAALPWAAAVAAGALLGRWLSRGSSS